MDFDSLLRNAFETCFPLVVQKNDIVMKIIFTKRKYASGDRPVDRKILRNARQGDYFSCRAVLGEQLGTILLLVSKKDLSIDIGTEKGPFYRY